MHLIPDLDEQLNLVDRYTRSLSDAIGKVVKPAHVKHIRKDVELLSGVKENLLRLEGILAASDATTTAKRRRIRTILEAESLTIPRLAERLNCTPDVVRNLVRPMVTSGLLVNDGHVLSINRSQAKPEALRLSGS